MASKSSYATSLMHGCVFAVILAYILLCVELFAPRAAFGMTDDQFGVIICRIGNIAAVTGPLAAILAGITISAVGVMKGDKSLHVTWWEATILLAGLFTPFLIPALQTS